jgi:cysteinyl-tRNA synthetase
MSLPFSVSLRALSGAFLGCFLASAAMASEPWLYQIQDPSPAAIASSGFAGAVIDYSSDGSAGGEFSAAQISTIKNGGVKVLAYFSIGEAEDYRFYFDPAWKRAATKPAWMGKENPDWKGNFKVRYWDPAWRDVALKPYLQRLVAQGFDGVYLDIVDAFEYWGNPSSYGRRGETRREGDPANEAEAAARMIELVEWIGDYASELRGGPVAVYPQNGERLLDYDSQGRYLAAIAGFGVEDLWFNGTRRQPARETNYRLPFLRTAHAAGKQILSVEYVDKNGKLKAANAKRIQDYLRLAEAEGFDFYVARTDRELDRVNALPGVQP